MEIRPFIWEENPLNTVEENLSKHAQVCSLNAFKYKMSSSKVHEQKIKAQYSCISNSPAGETTAHAHRPQIGLKKWFPTLDHLDLTAVPRSLHQQLWLAGVSGNCNLKTPGLFKIGNHFSRRNN